MQRIYQGGAVLAAICLVLIALLTLVQVIGRAIGVMIVDASAIAGYAMAASIFLALAYTLREGGHIRVGLLLTYVSPKVKRALEIWCLLVFSMLALYMAYACISFVHDSYRFADVSTGMLAIPLWIPQSSMALGTVLLAVALIEETIRVIRGNQPIYETKETQSFTSE